MPDCMVTSPTSTTAPASSRCQSPITPTCCGDWIASVNRNGGGGAKANTNTPSVPVVCAPGSCHAGGALCSANHASMRSSSPGTAESRTAQPVSGAPAASTQRPRSVAFFVGGAAATRVASSRWTSAVDATSSLFAALPEVSVAAALEPSATTFVRGDTTSVSRSDHISTPANPTTATAATVFVHAV